MVQLRIFVTLLLILTCFFGYSQSGVISGKISDENSSQPLAGSTITLIETSLTVTSESDGSYKLNKLSPGNYTIQVSYVGYLTKKIADITVIANRTTSLDIVLEQNKTNLNDVIVTATTARKENLNTLLTTRRNAGVVSDGISADLIRKSPDRNISDVLKRISGTTIQDNKFVVVRGMNDRYNEAMLNGSLLPSSEPDRKTFNFNIFPSEVVDNITIVKSAEPDLPGSFSGGLININTKDIPERNFFAIKVGAGYNTITTGKDYYDYKGGKKDWLGTDDGTRKLPSYFPNTNTYTALAPEQQDSIARNLPNNWAYNKKSSAPLLPTLNLSAGFTAKLSKNDYPKLGGIFGLTYFSSVKYSKYYRSDYGDFVTDTFYKYTDSAYNTVVLGSALGNLTMKINANNRIFFNSLYSVNSNDQTVIRNGPNLASGYPDTKSNSYFYTSNKIYNTQLGGEHYFPKSKFRVKWQGYYTELKRDEPDYRRNQYFQLEDGGRYFLLLGAQSGASTATGVHYYANVSDKAKGGNLDFSLPFSLFKQTQTFKFGGAYYHDSRERDARFFAPTYNTDLYPNFDFNLLTQPQGTVYAKENFNPETGFVLSEFYDPKNHYDGTIKNTAAFLMLDNRFTSKLRFVWGVRLEDYHNKLNTFSDNNDSVKVKNVWKDYLPSFNLIYNVFPKANLRASYSETVARPLYRELANLLFYDFLTNSTFFGNPNLTETHIYNSEIRWENFFSGSQYYSVSVFYKRFANPIEPYIAISGADSRTIGYKNVTKAKNYGVELELRKDFSFIGKQFENLVAYANVSLVKSKTGEYASAKDSSFRPLQGQSPYVVNASLQYTEPKTNIGLSVLYNVIGPQLALVGGLDQEPIWQRTHSTFDVKLTKAFLKNCLVELSFADILHKDDVQYWDLNSSKNHSYQDDGSDRLTLRQNFGMTVSLAVGYRF